MSSVTNPTIGVLIDDESTVMTSSHGMSLPKGAKFALKVFSLRSSAGVSANKLMGGSEGGAVGCFTWLGAEARVGVAFGCGGLKGDMPRSTVCVTCCPLAGFGVTAAPSSGRAFGSRRLFTSMSTMASPRMKRMSAPAGERSMLRKRRGFIWKVLSFAVRRSRARPLPRLGCGARARR